MHNERTEYVNAEIVRRVLTAVIDAKETDERGETWSAFREVDHLIGSGGVVSDAAVAKVMETLRTGSA